MCNDPSHNRTNAQVERVKDLITAALRRGKPAADTTVGVSDLQDALNVPTALPWEPREARR